MLHTHVPLVMLQHVQSSDGTLSMGRYSNVKLGLVGCLDHVEHII